MEQGIEEMEMPFDAKNSELYEWEYTIPEGCEVKIEDDKVIVRRKESEDEKIRKELIEVIKGESKAFPSSIIASKADSWLAWLEKQCEQKTSQKSEWSDEDERCVRNILWRLDGNILGPEYMDRCKRWLESIKDRIIPQKQWKPTKEQIKTLDDAIIYINATDNFSGSLDVLKNILEQLKKLK